MNPEIIHNYDQINSTVPEPTLSPSPMVTTPPNIPPQSPVAMSTPASEPADEYISNPFLNAVRGLILILKNNPVPALLSGLVGIVIYIVAEIFYILLPSAAKSSILVVATVPVYILIWLLIFGTYLAIGGASARAESITTGEAFKKSMSKLIPTIGLFILLMIMSLSFILLIIPGVYIMARSSLSFLIMFEENIGPIKSIKRSFKLTKGHVNEMLGAFTASIFMGSWGLLFGAVAVAPITGRYSDLRQLEESSDPKPNVHWLNYIYILVILLFVVPIIVISILIASGHFGNNKTTYGSNSAATSISLPNYNASSSSSQSVSSSNSTSSSTSSSSSTGLQPTAPGFGVCQAGTNFGQIAISGSATCSDAENVVQLANGSNYSSGGYSCVASKQGTGTQWSSYWHNNTFYSYDCSEGDNQIAFNWQNS